MFDHLLSKISKLSELSPVPKEIIERQRSEFSSVPDEYFVFLEEVGWGNIGGMMIYRGLLDANDFIQPGEEPWVGIYIFGDNWQGSLFGFDLDDGELMEITSEGYLESVDSGFAEFILAYAM